ncbi:MAG: ATP synthase F1 subunit gamma [Clostridiales bacterium]|nr:ATP synthase F1 subunit gamma [Clostridiales bacterium]
MSSISEIRHHIKVVSDTAKITRAMHLISSAKMRRAMALYEQNRSYTDTVREGIAYILENGGKNLDNDSRFIRPPKDEIEHRDAFAVFAGDKGLCGGYNSEVLKLASRSIQTHRKGKRPLIYAVGHMTGEHFYHFDGDINDEFIHIIHDPNLHNAAALAQELCDRFIDGEIDTVYVVFTRMRKIGIMEPVCIRALPLERKFFHIAQGRVLNNAEAPVFHPSPADLLDSMIPDYVTGLIYSALVQSYASEHYSRMTSMDAAQRNADEMLANLGVTLNRARQSAITQEITEIIAGIPDNN